MYKNQTILIVDDDVNICEVIGLYVKKEGFHAVFAHDGLQGIEQFQKETPGIVILDIMLPGADGWEVLKEIRKTSSVPVIMLSAKGETFDKVLGLELGADDYVVKPFDSKELMARVKAVLRRYDHKTDEVNEVVYPGLSVNKNDYVVKVNGDVVEMPPKELELLFFLASNPNKVYTRAELLKNVWKFEYYGDSRTVDVHVKRLREKINVENVNWSLETVWSVGYKFEVK